MQKYIKDWLKSRRKLPSDDLRCEYPYCNSKAVDIHHISNSYRGTRKHQEDGSDLISCCRYHHDYIHRHNNYVMREKLLGRVKTILDFQTQDGCDKKM